MKSLSDLNLVPVWVNPAHWAASARILMKGHGQRALAVMEQGQLLGVVTQEVLESAGDQTPCGTLARRDPILLPHTTSLLQAAQAFVDQDIDYAVVLHDSNLVGVLTSNMLLRELRRSWDPLTGLGWSDRIREWGTEHLAKGEEITVLFIDLDRFGQYNKQYGHIVGDRVLRRVAQMLKDSTDPQTDILVRFGGDEFAIASTRTRGEAEALAQLIKDRSGTMFMEDSYRPVTFSVGISGGRRTLARPDAHVGSMFEELLNAASKDCLARKRPVEELA